MVNQIKKNSGSTPAANGLAGRLLGGGEPTWEMAYFFPSQGHWTEADYLRLEDHCGGHIRVELTRGRLDVLPLPTEEHQDIIAFVLAALNLFVQPRSLGKVSFAGIRIRLQNGAEPKFREPDIAFMKAENSGRRHNEFWEGADLVMEVVSPDAHDKLRDYVTKKEDYALAGIAEYWIVDAEAKRIQIWVLREGAYQLHGDFMPGSKAESVLLVGFGVAVDEVLAREK